MQVTKKVSSTPSLSYSKPKLHKVLIIALAAFSIGLSACDKEDEPSLEIIPKNPKPEWGPTIRPEMQRVIEKLDELSSGVSLTTLTPQQARMAPSPADAVKAVMEEYGIAMPPSQVDTTGVMIPVEGGSIHARI